jgi:hypothetical protein
MSTGYQPLEGQPNVPVYEGQAPVSSMQPQVVVVQSAAPPPLMYAPPPPPQPSVVYVQPSGAVSQQIVYLPPQQHSGGVRVIVQQSGGQNPPMSPAALILYSGLCNCFDDLPTCTPATPAPLPDPCSPSTDRSTHTLRLSPPLLSPSVCIGLCGCCCPPCAAGLNASRVGLGNCVACAFAYMLFPCCVGGWMRQKISLLAGPYDPGFCQGCCLHMCCMCCALAQEGRATSKLADAGIREGAIIPNAAAMTRA